MKSALKSLVLLSAFISVNTHALDQSCQIRLRLSQEQKKELQSIQKEAALKIKELKPEILKAKLELKKILLSTHSTKEEAQAAAELIIQKKEQIQSVKSAQEIAELFDVLSPDQRVMHQVCESMKPQREIRIREPRIPRRIEPRGPRHQIPRHHHRPHRDHRHHGGRPLPRRI